MKNFLKLIKETTWKEWIELLSFLVKGFYLGLIFLLLSGLCLFFYGILFTIKIFSMGFIFSIPILLIYFGIWEVGLFLLPLDYWFIKYLYREGFFKPNEFFSIF